MDTPSQNGNNGGHSLFGGVLGGGVSKYDLELSRKAIVDGYPVSPEIRRLVVEQAETIARTAKNRRTKLAACKVLLAADSLNIKMAEVAVQDRHNDIIQSTAILRAAMTSPAAREAFAKISDQTAETKPQEPEQGQNGHSTNGTYNGSS